jgi:glyoxylase-like metal-dependent hydrolase (beta-lactamase superfamily II)
MRFESLLKRSLAAALAIAFAIVLSAHLSAAGVKTVRLYMFDNGVLKSADPKVLTDQGVLNTVMSVTTFLVVHPKGTLLWDAGVIPDNMVKPEGTTVARATVYKTLRGQLAEIGYTPAKITYLALSHMHYDHTANANEYAGSTWIVQRPEKEAMFNGQPPTNFDTYSALKNSKTMVIDGDLDVFGDGTVIIKSTPGHTPGHQSLFVKLAKTGPIVLSGDLYHYPEERTLKFMPPNDLRNKEKIEASRAELDAFISKTGAQLWIQHDLTGNYIRKKSPAYYE